MKEPAKIIYLDNNATTPIDERVLEVMMPYLTKNFANANSTHQFGLEAYEAVKVARSLVSDLIEAEPNEIIFTSGATEAINLAIKGVAEQYVSKGKHIVTSMTEHPAVLDTCRYLEKRGYELTYLPVEPSGLIDLSLLRSVLREDTILVSIMYVNNETGVIESIREISELTHSVNAIFMTDATQAIGKIPINVDDIGIDLMAFSGHKIYAPKGVGGLFVRQRGNRIKLQAIIHGGGHEKGLRSGTLNVAGIVALGKACQIALQEMKKYSESIFYLRDHLESELLKIESTFVNGDPKNRIYNVTNICFKGVDSDAMIIGLSNPESDYPLIAVSNGSACTSASIEPSHVLKALGLSESDAFCSLRFSLGRNNTLEEIMIVIDLITKLTTQLRIL